MNMVKLVVIQLQHKQAKVLSCQKAMLDLPTLIVEDGKIEDKIQTHAIQACRNDIFYKHIDLNLSWVKFELIDVTLNQQDGYTEIIYGCMIPFGTDLKHKDMHWLDIDIKNKDFDLTVQTMQKLGGITYG